MAEEKPSQQPGEKKHRDAWDKCQILFSALMPLALFALGYWGNQALEADQNRRAFVELLSRREESDSTLRKDMFGKVIEQFIGKNNPADLDTRILHLELLTYNFHESIDLGPLLKQVYEESWTNQKATAQQRKRLQKLAVDIATRELDALRESGCVETAEVEFEKLLKDMVLVGIIQKTCPENRELPSKWFRVDVMTNPAATDVRKLTEVDVMLSVRPNEKAQDREKRVEFTVSPFDFPMIDNVRLEDRSRVSVVMTRVHDGGVTLALVYFPGSRTSLKDKPFHDEVLRTLTESPKR